MTAVPPSAGPETDGPSAGYYPDPSIPGFVRYWDGLGWLPGTSRPAPGPDEVLPPPRTAARPSGPSMRFVPPPARGRRPEPEPEPESEPEPVPVAGPEPEPEPFVPQRTLPPLGGAVEQSGPIFLDETGMLPEPRTPAAQAAAEAGPETDAEEESGSRWIADAAQQRGLMETGAAPRWVSWGVLDEPAPKPAAEAAAPAPAAAAPLSAAPAPVPAAASVPAPTLVAAPATAPAPAEPRMPAEPRRAVPVPARPAPGPSPTAPPVRTLGPVPAVAAGARAGAAAASRAGVGAGAGSGAAAGRARPMEPRPALLVRRVGARLLDTAVLAGAVSVVGMPLVRQAVVHLQDKIDSARELSGQTRIWLVDPTVLRDAGLLLVALLVVGFVIEALPTAAWGRTLGKAVFGLRVVDRRSKRAPALGRSLVRWLTYLLSMLLLVGLFGLLRGLTDRPWRRGWHDRAGRTLVAAGKSRAARRN